MNWKLGVDIRIPLLSTVKVDSRTQESDSTTTSRNCGKIQFKLLWACNRMCSSHSLSLSLSLSCFAVGNVYEERNAWISFRIPARCRQGIPK